MDFDKDGELVLQSTGWESLKSLQPSPQEAKYEITGPSSQVITFQVNAGETITSEPGSLMYMSSGMTPAVSYEGGCSRCCSGECCYALKFTNDGASESRAFVALTPSFPTSKVVPVDLTEVGGSLICDQGAFMASYGDVKVEVDFDCNFTRCCCAGTNLIRQKLKGTGTAFLTATGTIVQKVLEPGEKILADGNCILAFASTVGIDVRKAGSFIGMVGGGEGIFNTVLTGPGLIMIHSLNQYTFTRALQAQKMVGR